MKTMLFCVDIQNDFVLPGAPLQVNGAVQSAKNLEKFLIKNIFNIDEIVCTLDSHQRLHIAHPDFWIDKNGNNPKPFTVISLDDINKGIWKSSIKSLEAHAVKYVEYIEKNKSKKLTIWPLHCLIGTTGNAIVENIINAVYDWEGKRKAKAIFHVKGSVIGTEHYGALIAEMVLPQYEETALCGSIIKLFKEYDRIFIAGQAKDYCVMETLRQIVDVLGEDYLKNFIILNDAMDCINETPEVNNFYHNLEQKYGMKIGKTVDYY
jgi:nicotinamidase/pyrazinamidase